MKRTFLVSLCVLLIAAFLAPSLAWSSDKPRIAVLEFKNKADNQWWYHGGAEAAQDVFVTELVKSGKFRVVEREQLAQLMREKNLSLSGDVDAKTAVQAGKLLGVQYFLTGSVTEYGTTDAGASARSVRGLPSFSVKKRTFTAAMNARIIDVETGDIVWADEASAEEKSSKVRVSGVGGGVDDQRMFDKVMKPVIQQLTSSIKAADL